MQELPQAQGTTSGRRVVDVCSPARQIKCNRTRPTCEACHVFNCPCIYDAVPKKRGPKTDVLDALLKRVDGLEKRLVSEGKSDDAADADAREAHHAAHDDPALDIAPRPVDGPSHATQLVSPDPAPAQPPALGPDLLLDTYFARIHGKPYYILDEATTRHRSHAHQLPPHLAYALYAVSARYAARRPCPLSIPLNFTCPDMRPILEATPLQSKSARSTPAAPG